MRDADGNDRSRRHWWAALPLAAALLAVGCSASSTTSGTASTTATPGSSAPGTSAAGTSVPGTGVPGTGVPGTGVASASCVKDVDKVIATKPIGASTSASLPADLVTKLDAAAKSSFGEAAAPGAIVGVRTPQGTWTSTYGYADPTAKTPMTTDMHTRIGSVTKTFTGTVVLQLAEQGKLSLDDTIDKYVDGIPNGNRITLRLLANMTSGVASYTASTAFTDKYFAHPETIFEPDELIAVGVAESPIFEPGAKFNYSNTNTVLLGKVIEKVTGQPVGDVFKKQILEPLSLNNTSWPGDSPEIPAPYPQGFTLQGTPATPDKPTDPSNAANATNWNPAWGWTAGELISRLDDLLVYGRALGTGQGLLRPATQAERLTSFPGASGYGLAMGCVDGWVGHTGELPGYNTSVFYDTTTDTTVIVEVNSDISSGSCSESPVLTDNPSAAVCSAPATRMFVALSTALGHTFTPPPAR